MQCGKLSLTLFTLSGATAAALRLFGCCHLQTHLWVTVSGAWLVPSIGPGCLRLVPSSASPCALADPQSGICSGAFSRPLAPFGLLYWGSKLLLVTSAQRCPALVVFSLSVHPLGAGYPSIGREG